jgi:TPP-dependent pyruvate/acetoin dehydrogenase alpha subunit
MKYVPKELVATWQARDPIDRQEARVRELGVDVDALRAEVDAEIEAGVQAALAMPMPDPATATDGVFADEAVELGDGRAPWSGFQA